jgi:hypothetical protein
MKQIQRCNEEDPRFVERLGAGYSEWIRENLTPFLATAIAKKGIPRVYTRAELQSHAEFIATEYVLDESRRGKSLRDFVPQTQADVLRVREYVAQVARNEIFRAVREEDSPTGVHTPNLNSVKSDTTKAAVLRASAFAGVHTITLDDGEVSATAALDMVGIEDVDPQFFAGTTSMDPVDICEMRESTASWSDTARDFAEALEEFRDFVLSHPDVKVARRERLLLGNNRVNSSYLLARALHEVDKAQALRFAPAMCVRWIYDRDTPSKVLTLLGSATAGRSLADVYESEARSLVSWARKYTKLTKLLREPAMRQVVADARASVERWRGAYGNRD